MSHRTKVTVAPETMSSSPGGFIFLCNGEIVEECREKLVFGHVPKMKVEVAAITPGVPLFLFNISSKEMYGGYVAKGAGGFNLDPTAFTSMVSRRGTRSGSTGRGGGNRVRFSAIDATPRRRAVARRARPALRPRPRRAAAAASPSQRCSLTYMHRCLPTLARALARSATLRVHSPSCDPHRFRVRHAPPASRPTPRSAAHSR